MISPTIANRTAAAGGLGYFVLTMVGIAMSPMPDPGADTSELRSYLAAVSPGRAVLATYLVALAAAWLLAFVIHLGNDDSPGARLAQVLSGVGVSLLAVTACSVSAAVIAGPLAQPLLPLASTTSWGSQVPFALAALLLTTSGRLPAWLTTSGRVIAAAVLVAVPFAALTPAAHIPPTLLALWYATASIRALRRPEPAPDAAHS